MFLLRKPQTIKKLALLNFILQRALPAPNNFYLLTTSSPRYFSDYKIEDFEPADSLLEESLPNKSSKLYQELSKCSTITSIIQFYKTNIIEFKTEEKFWILRVFGRLAKYAIKHKEEFDSDYSKFMKEEIIPNIENLKEFELLDFLFFYRKFRAYALPHYITFDNFSKAQKKIEKFIQNKQYSIRSLISIYCDINLASWGSSILVNELSYQIKANINILTPISTILILKAATSNKINLNKMDYFLIDSALRRYDQSPSEFDLNQKCMIFQFVAALDLVYMNEKQFFTQTLIIINNELKEQMKDLAENNIINIVRAFVLLPREFDFDLMIFVHEIMITTLQTNPNNINTKFLLKYLISTSLFQKSRKIDMKDDIFAKEILTRLDTDSYLLKHQSLKLVMTIYSGSKKFEIFDKIAEKLDTLIDVQDNCFMIIEFLAINNYNIERFLNKLIENLESFEGKSHYKIRLYCLLLHCQRPDYLKIIEDFRLDLEKIMITEPHHLMNVIGSNFLNFKFAEYISENLFLKAIEHIQLKREKIHEVEFFRMVFLSLQSKETIKIWYSFLSKSQNKFNKYIESFFQFDNFNQYQIQFVLLLLKNLKKEFSSYQRILRKLYYNNAFLESLVAHETFYNQFFYLLLEIENKSDPFNFFFIYPVLLKLENIGLKSPELYQTYQMCFEHYLKFYLENTKPMIEITVSNTLFLMKNGYYSKFAISKIVEYHLNYLKDATYATKFAIASYNLSPDPQNQKDLKVFIINNLKSFKDNIDTFPPKKILNILENFLSFHEFVEENTQLIITLIEKNKNSFLIIKLKILYAINDSDFKKAPELYYLLISKILDNSEYYLKFSQNISIRIFLRLAQLKYYSQNFCKEFFQIIEKNIDTFKVYEIINVLLGCQHLQICDQTFFDLIVLDILKKQQIYKNYLDVLLETFFKLAFIPKSNFNDLLTFFEDEALKKYSHDNLNYVILLLILSDNPNEKELIEIFIGSSKKIQKSYDKKKLVQNKFNFLLILNYLKSKYNTDDNRKIQTFIQENKEIFKKEVSKTLKYSLNVFVYLKCLNMNPSLDYIFKNFEFELALPDRKIIVFIQNQDPFYYKHSQNLGEHLIIEKTYSNFLDHKIIKIPSLDFMKLNGNDKIAFLKKLLNTGGDIIEENLNFERIEQEYNELFSKIYLNIENDVSKIEKSII